MGKKSHARYKPSAIPLKPELSTSEITDEFDPTTFSKENAIDNVLIGDELTRGTSDKDWDQTSQNLTAPVHLPTRDSLTVDLVPYDLIVKLDEYRGDYDLYSGLSFLFLGAIIGFILDLLVNHQKINSIIVTILASLSLLLITNLFFFVRSLKRVNKKKNEIKNQMRQINKE